MRILVVSSESLPGAEDRNLPLARELIRRGHEVVHTGPTHAMAGYGFTMTTYDPGFAEVAEAVQANTRLFSSWEEMVDLVDRAQVLLFGVAKGYDGVVRYAAREGKVVLWQRDVSADHAWIRYADLVAVRGSGDVEVTMERTGLPRERIVVTGCTMFDRAAPQNMRLDRQAFCRKYGLRADNKIVVFCTTGPAAHIEPLKEDYRRICAAVRGLSGFDIVIKPHPREFARIKQGLRYSDAETPTWRQLAPGVPACEPCDIYDCYRHAEVLVTQNSSLFKEAALFHKPILEISIAESRANEFGVDPGELSRLLPARRFRPPSRRPWTFLGCLGEVYEQLPAGPIKDGAANLMKTYHSVFGNQGAEYIGSECSVAELADVLAGGAYVFDDAESYEALVERYCFANDGLAYLRVADAVEGVARNPVLATKLKGLRGLARFGSYLRRKSRPFRARLKGRIGGKMGKS